MNDDLLFDQESELMRLREVAGETTDESQAAAKEILIDGAGYKVVHASAHRPSAHEHWPQA